MDGVGIDRARAAKSRVVLRLEDLPQVNGIGLVRIGQGYGIKVNLSEPLGNQEAIPPEVDGVPVVVEFVGRIAAR